MHPEEPHQANQAVPEPDIIHWSQDQSDEDWSNRCSTSAPHSPGYHYPEDENNY